MTTEHKPKVILMVHDLPRTTDRDIDEDSLLEWLSEADVIFSVGKAVESEIISAIASLPPEERPGHKLYIPSYPLELFNIHRDEVEGNKVQGTQNITRDDGRTKRFRDKWTGFSFSSYVGNWSIKAYSAI